MNMPLAQTSTAPPNKSVWKRYAGTLTVSIGFSLWIGYRLLAVFLNPIPQESDLIRVPIKVISVKPMNPHLWVELENGSQRAMEFPVSIVATRSFKFHGLDEKLQQKLPGCDGVAWGVPIRYVIQDKFHVWKLTCGKTSMNYEDAVNSVKLSRDIEFKFSIYGLLFMLFVFVPLIYMAERKVK